MNVLILGSGGREHTIAHKIKQSKKLDKLFTAPGNAGTENISTNIPLDINNFEEIKVVVLKNKINLIVIGPEDPLVNGIVDFFLNDNDLKNVKVIGADKVASQLEGSKEFAKKFMDKYNIPTAKYKSFDISNIKEGFFFLEELNAPYVLKADGLAGGKGVLILDDLQEAKDELSNMIENNKFGNAGDKVVIEEFLDGVELSVFVITDGKNYKILPEAKDYKRIGVGDTGLNTGGMGAISPVPFADKSFIKKIEKNIIQPTIDGISKEKFHYKGFIFFGLIKVNGDPFVIEYNIRMGDPETEVVIPRLENDLLDLLEKTYDEKLNEVDIKISKKHCTTVIMVSGGYPENYEKGLEITGIENVEGSIIFHSGTKYDNNRLVTNGGRVLAITSFGNNLKDALTKSYTNVYEIEFENNFYREDIGYEFV